MAFGRPQAPPDQDFEPVVRGPGPRLADFALRGGEQLVECHGSSLPAGAACSSYATPSSPAGRP
ncbi:MAG TPA: hypothetical protein VGF55_33455, partial [Gemmataceae bacterium]